MRRIASSYVKGGGLARGGVRMGRMLPGDAPHAVPDDAGAEGGLATGRAVGPGVGEVLRGKFDADGAPSAP